jgi:hypothetical protein
MTDDLLIALNDNEMDSSGVHFRTAMDCQLLALVLWKSKLNQECYRALHRYAVKHRTANRHICHDVARGDKLTEFVCNWRPRPVYGRVKVEDMVLPEVLS